MASEILVDEVSGHQEELGPGVVKLWIPRVLVRSCSIVLHHSIVTGGEDCETCPSRHLVYIPNRLAPMNLVST